MYMPRPTIFRLTTFIYSFFTIFLVIVLEIISLTIQLMAYTRHDDLEVTIALSPNDASLLSQNTEHDRGPAPSRRYQSTRYNDEQSKIRQPIILCVVCMATFNTQNELYAHKDREHFFCKMCANNKCHRNRDGLEKHYQKAHPHSWCRHCRTHFNGPALKDLHDRLRHEYCRRCKKCFKTLSELDKHMAEKHPAPNVPAPSKKPLVGKYYSLLNVSPTASHEEMVRAARKARVDAHPDRLCRPGLSHRSRTQISDQAKEVGRAADVLCDVYKRRDYDKDVNLGYKE